MDRVKRFPTTLILLGGLVTILILIMAIPKSWEEATRKNRDGSYSLSREWEEAIAQKEDKIITHELYMLVAAQEGYYLCKHCPAGKFHLRSGEVYRYGTTGNGKNSRGYTAAWESTNLLNFIHICFGDEATVKLKETALIGTYVIHHENMKRPLPGEPGSDSFWYRLVLPPGNNSLN